MRSEAGWTDYAWAALALVAAVVGAVAITGGVWRALVDGDLASVLGAPIGIAFYYWIGMGGWRRTTWGRPATAVKTVRP